MMKTIITNIRIITMNPEADVIENGFVAFRGDLITDVGVMKDCHPEAGDDIIDGQRGILLPGMVNLHTHLGMIPFRGLQDDCKDRLRRFLLPMEERFMTPELAALSTKYAICELISSGVTTFFDMYYHENRIADEIADIGIRAVLGETVMEEDYSRGKDYEAPAADLTDVTAFVRRWQKHPLIRPAIAPHGTNTCSRETLMACHDLSAAYQIPLTIHVSEMDYEVDYFKKQYQMTPIAFLNSIGVLDERTVAAHCIRLAEQDFDILASNGVSVAHCIGSNTKAAKGVAPVAQMILAGIGVGLGSDGPASGNTLDIMTQMKLFANFHKNETQDRTAFPAAKILSYGTIGGARALHMEDRIGSVEVGKQADLVLLETKSANMYPVYDPHSTVVYSANGANVEMVFIAGKCLLKNRKLVTLNLQDARRELEEELERISFGKGFI